MKSTFKYPLSAPLRVGVENLKRLNLTVEAGTSLNLTELEPFYDRIISAHAPFGKDGMRLNIAATDDDFRQMSLNYIIDYIDTARHLPNLKKINMHCAPKQWKAGGQTGGQVGDYDRLIDGIRQVAAFADEHGFEVVVENNRAYWDSIADDVSAAEADRREMNEYFGTAPEEWIQIGEDINRPNVSLCLDPSHSCTYAQIFPDSEKRVEVMMAYLAKPELLGHVHWNDNDLFGVQGRQDSHLCIGKGSLPIEFHRTIKGLDATLLLEHFYSIEELEAELVYIDEL
jgi:sugar phosphate isomerase/epimerase